MGKKYTDKVLLLGVDGLDPKLTSKFMKEGKLPNIKKFVDAGAQRVYSWFVHRQQSLHHCGPHWLPAHCLLLMVSLASGDRTQ